MYAFIIFFLSDKIRNWVSANKIIQYLPNIKHTTQFFLVDLNDFEENKLSFIMNMNSLVSFNVQQILELKKKKTNFNFQCVHFSNNPTELHKSSMLLNFLPVLPVVLWALWRSLECPTMSPDPLQLDSPLCFWLSSCSEIQTSSLRPAERTSRRSREHGEAGCETCSSRHNLIKSLRVKWQRNASQVKPRAAFAGFPKLRETFVITGRLGRTKQHKKKVEMKRSHLEQITDYKYQMCVLS